VLCRKPTSRPKLAVAVLTVVVVSTCATSAAVASASTSTTVPPSTTRREVVVVTSRNLDAPKDRGTRSWGFILGGLALLVNLVNITVWRDVVRKGWPRGWHHGRFYLAALLAVVWALWSVGAVIRWLATAEMHY
jgi:hypothetical protein